VVLNRADYVHEMEVNLLDTNTYQRITRDSTKKLINDLRNTLVRRKNMDYIDNTLYRLNITDGNFARIYGLPKIHKPGNPFRVIVSAINNSRRFLSFFAQYHSW